MCNKRSLVGVGSKPFANTKMPVAGVEEGSPTISAREGLWRVFRGTEGELVRADAVAYRVFYSVLMGTGEKFTT